MSTRKESEQGSKASGGGDPLGPPDADVIRRVLDGHRNDYEVLVRRYQGRLYRFAFGMVDDADAATDLVKDTFVKAYTTLESCRDPSQFASWAYQILCNRCRDYLENLRPSHEPLEEGRELVSENGRPARELDRAEPRWRLRDALQCLPGAHREAFLLKHLHGHTYSEIAEILGASVSAIKMRVHRSRELLRAHIESERQGDDDVTVPDSRSSFEVEAFDMPNDQRRAGA